MCVLLANLQLQEELLALERQGEREKKQAKSVEDCEIELRLCFDSVPQVSIPTRYSQVGLLRQGIRALGSSDVQRGAGSQRALQGGELQSGYHSYPFPRSSRGIWTWWEVCLNEQISLQSDSLFAAIRQLHDFQLQVNSTLQTIRDLKSAPFSPLMLRVSMKSVEATHTIPPLLVPVYVRRINNLKKVQRLVDLSSAAET